MSKFPIANEPTTTAASEPRREPSIHADVLTPLLQAVFVAVLLTAIAAAIMSKRHNFDVAALLIIFCLLAVIVFLWRVKWAEGTIQRIEETVHMDLNQDGTVGRRPTPTIVNGQTHTAPSAETMTDRMLAMIAVAHRHGTDIRSVRARLPTLSDEDYNDVRNALLNAKLATWKGKGHTTGWTFADLPLDELLDQARRRIMWSDAPQTA